VSPPASKVVVFLHSGDYDRVQQGLSIAAAAVASGRRVEVYLFWWALERFLKDALDEPDFAGRDDVSDRFESRGMPTPRVLLGHLKESGLCTLAGCTGSLGALGAEAEAGQSGIDVWLGWSAILQRTAGVTDRFYL
jgi:peroxiredoxin family protein